MAALSGERTVRRADAIRLMGAPVGRLAADARRALGLAFVPEERLGRGAVPEMTLAENALLTAHARGLVTNGFVRESAVRAYAGETIAQYRVKAGGVGRGRALALRRQPAEVHRRPRDPPGAEGDDRRAADLGRRRRRRGADPPGADRPARRRRRRAGRLRGAGRAVRGLRPHRGDRAGPPVGGDRRERDQRRGDRADDVRVVHRRRGRRARHASPSRTPHDPPRGAPGTVAAVRLGVAADRDRGDARRRLRAVPGDGQEPARRVPRLLHQAGRLALRPGRAAAQGRAADADRGRPRRRLPRERVEHRRGGPAHARRDRRRRRRARAARQRRPRSCCRR